jgi:subtilisin family serine protease
MRPVSGTKGNLRASALWGKKTKGEARSSALWGKPGRSMAAFLAIITVLAAPVAAPAKDGQGHDSSPGALVPDGLFARARANPDKLFSVIVQARAGKSSTYVANLVQGVSTKGKSKGKAKGLKKKFSAVNGVAAQLTGAQLVQLAKQKGILAITRDRKLVASGQFSNEQGWPQATGVDDFWSGQQLSGLSVPAIAIIDSGVQSSRLDFGGRVVKQVRLTTLLPNSAGDGRGHGTLVADLAAGSARYAGAAPTAPIVSLDVMDDNGMAMTSDVIAAADWILANKGAYNIRVANFSLQSATPSTFAYDPLNQAVERLWFSGVVVVASAGNYGDNGQPTTVAYAPGNDPFVITVGASDMNNTPWTAADDFLAPWSAFGYTLDGFAKPDIGAPGRQLIGPVPALSTMAREHPERITSTGYMWMSGTSFAAPIVSGAAALVLAHHPNWTPDQVKGALMLTAQRTAAGTALGVGELNAKAATQVSSPPNPNLALNQFVGSDGAGGLAFDAASWASTAQADASWNSASWNSASWANASWANASWNSASWANASWNSASWAAASWNSASWAAASWAAASWAAASWNAASWAAASWAA